MVNDGCMECLVYGTSGLVEIHAFIGFTGRNWCTVDVAVMSNASDGVKRFAGTNMLLASLKTNRLDCMRVVRYNSRLHSSRY